MSLTTDDLSQIKKLLREEVRPIVREEVRPIVREEVRNAVGDEVGAQVSPISRRLTSVEEKLESMDGKLTATEADVKEIYKILSNLQKYPGDKGFRRLSIEDKLFRINSELQLTAKQAGITLSLE